MKFSSLKTKKNILTSFSSSHTRNVLGATEEEERLAQKGNKPLAHQ